MLLSAVLLITWVLIKINTWKPNGQSVLLKKKKNSLKKELVTTTSVFVYKLKDSLRTLKPFLYYQPFQNTEQEATIFGIESFILFQIPHSCRHAHLQVKVQPTSEKQLQGSSP